MKSFRLAVCAFERARRHAPGKQLGAASIGAKGIRLPAYTKGWRRKEPRPGAAGEPAPYLSAGSGMNNSWPSRRTVGLTFGLARSTSFTLTLTPLAR